MRSCRLETMATLVYDPLKEWLQMPAGRAFNRLNFQEMRRCFDYQNTPQRPAEFSASPPPPMAGSDAPRSASPRPPKCVFLTHLAGASTYPRTGYLRLQAERRLGEMLRDMPKATGTAGMGRPSLGGSTSEPPKTEMTLAEIGIDKKVSMRAQRLAALPDG